MKFITSFNPHKRVERQLECLKSWQKYNIPVCSVQHESETDCESIFSGVEWIYTNTYNKFFQTNLPFINSLLAQCPGIIINSDIDLSWSEEEFKYYSSPSIPIVGIRTEEGVLNPWGIDVFIIPHTYPPSPEIFSIGKPGWDYWLMIELDKKPFKVIKTGMNHAPHDDRWNSVNLSTAQTLLSNIYGMPSQLVSRYIQTITGRLCPTKHASL